MIRNIGSLAVLSFLFVAGCAKKPVAPAQPTVQQYLRQATQPARRATTAPGGVARGAALFDRLGATPKVGKIVDDFLVIAQADPRVNFTRKGHPKAWQLTPENIAALRSRFIEFISNTTGGNADYSGADMQTAHAGMEINAEEFDAALADFQQAMVNNKVGENEQRDLLAVLAATRSRVVRSGVAAPATSPASRL